MPKRHKGKRVSELKSFYFNSEDGGEKKINIQFSDIDSLDKKKEDGNPLYIQLLTWRKAQRRDKACI